MSEPLSPFKRYCDIMKKRYKDQPIIDTDWPPKIGANEFFGKLEFVEKNDKEVSKKEMLQIQWNMLRGKLDEICSDTNLTTVKIEDILRPSKRVHFLRVLLDGPPGIGKTTVCRKVLNMWANGELRHQVYYDLVLYCPLRDDRIAQASTLFDLFIYQCPEVEEVVKYIDKSHGKGLLMIFDGWDELSIENRRRSLVAEIICMKRLAECSVIVTSRTYASASLLDLNHINRHIKVMGLHEWDINRLIRRTLESHESAQLIEELNVRTDILSLCYIPLVCSIIILVYKTSDGKLPTTLTEVYDKFLLQTIRRHVQINSKSFPDIGPRDIFNLNMLPAPLNNAFEEICHLAYTGLREKRLTFSSQYLHQISFKTSLNMNWLGLMTAFVWFDEENYQFLHLTIQEFLAAQWITKNEKESELFQQHFDDDHFKMCLRFVAGLNHLQHEDYKQYFTYRGSDLFCKTRPLSRFDELELAIDHPESASSQHGRHIVYEDIFYKNFFLHIVQLLYESQNTELCNQLAYSIKEHSLCLHNLHYTMFDSLCIGYFIAHSQITWKILHLGETGESFTYLCSPEPLWSVRKSQVRLIFAELKKSSRKTWFQKVYLQNVINPNSIFFQLSPSGFQNIRELHCTTPYYYHFLGLTHLLRLQHLEVLNLYICDSIIVDLTSIVSTLDLNLKIVLRLIQLWKY